MSDLRTAAQQALEALEYYQHRRLEWDYSDDVAIAALRAVLAQPVQEPVYWEVRCTAHPKWMRVDEQQFDEYVANGWEGQRLYTAPPQRNFCPRCGKRTNDIHTCTPPEDADVHS